MVRKRKKKRALITKEGIRTLAASLSILLQIAGLIMLFLRTR